MGKELKSIPHNYGHICVGFFLTPSPSSDPTSVLSFYPILIVEENVSNTLELVRVDLLGSLGLVRVDFLGSQNQDCCRFPRSCAGVRHWEIMCQLLYIWWDKKTIQGKMDFCIWWDKASHVKKPLS